jgi:hypothetical protein
MRDRWTDEETEDARWADTRGFFKVEIWSDDDVHVERLLYAGNSLDRARHIFEGATDIAPNVRYYIRQGARVVDKWPRS